MRASKGKEGLFSFGGQIIEFWVLDMWDGESRSFCLNQICFVFLILHMAGEGGVGKLHFKF